MHSASRAYRRFIAWLLACLIPLTAILIALHTHFKPSFDSIRSSRSHISQFEAHPSLQQPYVPPLQLQGKLLTAAENRLLIGVVVTNVYELSLKPDILGRWTVLAEVAGVCEHHDS